MAELRISDLGSLNFSHDWKQPFQIQESYVLKYLTTDTIRVQYALSSDAISPAVRLLNVQTGEITILTAVEVSATDEYSTYNVTISDLPTGCYVFQFYLNEVLAWASFSIHEELENSRLFEYTNEKNDHETVFTEPFFFRVEGVFLPQELTPQVESNNFRDQRYIQHLLSASPYNVHTLTVGGKFGAPNYVEDKLNRIFSCTSVLIDGEEYTRAEGTSTEKEVFSPAYPLYRYKIQVEKSTNGEKIIPLSYSILISGRVIDAVSGRGVPGAQVAITLDDHLITSAISDANGNFAYSWQISESEYTALIAQFGITVRWSAQGSGYLSGKGVFGYLQAYQDAVQQGISHTIMLGNISDFWVDPAEIVFDVVGGAMILTVHFPNDSWVPDTNVSWASGGRDSDTTLLIEAGVNTSGSDREGVIYIDTEDFGETITVVVPVRQIYRLRLTDVPIGYNMRGKTIVFTETDRPMTDQDMFNREDWIGGAVDGRWTLMSTFDGGIGSEAEIYCSLPGDTYTRIWFVNTGWDRTSFTFPDDQDYIVNINDLRPSTGDSWGWQYAIITD